MANQNPQPEIYTTRHSFDAAATQGTTVTQTVYTNQANTEEVRIYAVSVQFLDTNGGSDDATVRIWDYQTKACIQVLDG